MVFGHSDQGREFFLIFFVVPFNVNIVFAQIEILNKYIYTNLYELMKFVNTRGDADQLREPPTIGKQL